jgi:hypothetical protein
MFKNVASQKIEFFAFDTTTGAAKTGDAANITGAVTKDFGTATAFATNTATEVSSSLAPGVYSFPLAQAETNADHLLCTAKSSTANVGITPRFVETNPPNFTSLAIDSSGNVKIQTGLKKGVAVTIAFTMRDSTGAPLTGSTVTVSRAIDTATTFTSVGAATEKASGWYHIALGSGDTNGTCVALRFSGSGGSGTPADGGMTLVFEP